MDGISAAASGRHLIELADSQVIVVDLQPSFFHGHAASARRGVGDATARAAWLVGVAVALGVPVTITEEDPARNGPTERAVLDRVPPGTTTFEKLVFGLADQPDILAAVEGLGRGTAILVGAETDVCVAQSAVGLVAHGFRVIVVADATFSPGRMHDAGLRRVEQAGVLVTHAKGVYYEWVRTLAAARQFQEEHPDLVTPPGFDL
jgi:nicotinamidase-related amidase